MRIVTSCDPGYSELSKILKSEAGFAHPLYSPLHREYYREYYGRWKFNDLSFVIEQGGQPLSGLLWAYAEPERGLPELSWFGLPMRYLQSKQVSAELVRGAARVLKRHFSASLKEHAPLRFLFVDPLDGGRANNMARLLLEQGAHRGVECVELVDLRPPVSQLHGQLRKSYKAAINWGLRNLETQVLHKHDLSRSEMEAFRRLHVEVAGRETRSRRTWELQAEIISAGEGFAVLSRLGQELVSAAFFPCSSRHCYYGVSASRRELFDKPISHSVLWAAALHAKSEGLAVFDLGAQVFAGEGSEKERSISRFKRGFGGQTAVHLVLKGEV